MHNFIKTTFIMLITLLVFEPLVLYASYASDARDGVNDFLESDLNINVSDSLKPLTESFNATDRKGTVPEVSIRFTTTNPKIGDEITASADVLGLSNLDDAYYVWYLKGPNRDSGDQDQQHVNAVRAQAAVYYDEDMFDPGSSPFNVGLIDSVGYDSDSYTAKMGGDNGIVRGEDDEYTDYCYVYDVETGSQYEIAKGGSSTSGCEDGFVPRCMIEDNTLQCPTIVGPVESEMESESETGEESSTSSTVTTVAGMSGQRFFIVRQCLDTGAEPICDMKSKKLNCGANSTKYYACSSGDYCVSYDTLHECELDNEESGYECELGSEKSVSSYDYEGDINIPTPFCVKKDSSTGQLWTDPNSNGCPTTGGGSANCVEDSPHNRTIERAGIDTYELSNVSDGTDGGEWAICFETNMPGITGAMGTYVGIIAIGYEQNGQKKYAGRDQLWEKGSTSGPGDGCHVARDLSFVIDTEGQPDGNWTPMYCDGGETGNFWAPGVGQAVEFLVYEPVSKQTNTAEYTFENDMVEYYKSKGCNVCEGGCRLPEEGATDAEKKNATIQKPTKCGIGESEGNSCDEKYHAFPEELGQGDFDASLEEKYGTNPIDERTTPLALNDAALAVGLGMKDFTWEYQDGDEITVVVEGMGAEATKHEDATYQTVFAMPSPGCKDLIEDSSSYSEMVKTKVMTINTTELTPKECVQEDLFIKPGTSEYDSLNVELSSGSSTASQSSTASGLGQEMTISALAN
ncbi:MAG: hypothetical protein U9Q12_02965, partial [Patescibacteria group bacterium]|nr:hypothetical protein [Patescibacteria group bacterium]